MVHLDRPRYIDTHIAKTLRYSPIVGVIGQRQVGKTTTIEKHAGRQYVSLDNQADLTVATQDPKLFLDQLDVRSQFPIAIDECQKAPPLFSALKLKVQNKQRPGQYLLSGSVRFTSRKAIQESLTGRISNLEMLPMSFAEAHKLTLGDILKLFTLSDKERSEVISKRMPKFDLGAMENFLTRGGLPGICFLREAAHRNRKFRSHIETLLQRDIQLIVQTTVPYDNLRQLLAFFARYQGQSFNYSQASRETQISANTLKKLVFAFENMFLLRRLTNLGDLSGTRFFFEDQGMASFLAPYSKMQNLIRLSFSQIFHQLHYQYMDTLRLEFYSTRGGAEIPLVFEVNHKKFGFILCESEKPNLSVLRSVESFLRAYPDGKVMIISPHKSVNSIHDQLIQVPLSAII